MDKENEETEEIDENPEETPGEAHREGEFEDLRNRIDGIAKMIEQMNKNIAMFISSAGESAGGSADVDDEPPADVDLYEIPGVDEFDLSI